MTEAEWRLYTLLNRSEYDDWYAVEGMDIPGDINTARDVYLTLSIVFTIASGLILATSLRRQIRKQSPSWYLYHLVCLTVVFGLVLNPMLFAGVELENLSFCIFLSGATRTFVFLHSVNVILLNIEVMFTVMLPSVCFANRALLRFAMTIGFVWSFSVVFVVILMSSAAVVDNHFGACWHLTHAAELLLNVSQNWLPATIATCSTIAIIAIYIRAQCTQSGSYNQFPETPGHVANRRDWFICILLINAIFIIAEVLVYDMQYIFQFSVITEVYLQMCCNIAHFVMPMTMFALRPVRNTVCCIVSTVYKALTCQKDADFIEEQALSMDTVSEDIV